MPDDRPAAAPTRRSFLRTIAVAPVLAAGCATSRAAAPVAGAATPAGTAAAEAAPAPAAAGDDPLAAIRNHALAMDAEPAFVFRAAVARPQE